MSDTNGTTHALESATPRLRGDLCPSWCAGNHAISRGVDSGGRAIHPDDEGVFHYGPLTEWFSYSQRLRPDPEKQPPITVQIECFRQDNFDDDEAPWIRVTGPIDTDGLTRRDARLLGEALVRAVELMEDGHSAPVD